MAVVRAPSVHLLEPLTEALLAGGISAIEVTTSTPDALTGIRNLARVFGQHIELGLGTVLDAETAMAGIQAGAQYLVSPVLEEAVLDEALAEGIPCFPGALTPTEVLQAHRLGAPVVKVFPGSVVGPSYLRDLLAPMPFLKLMPTGGVEPENVRRWLDAGAYAVGAGSSLAPRAVLEAGDWAEVTRRALLYTGQLNPAP